MKIWTYLISGAVLMLLYSKTFALESAKVLPKGVRNFNLRVVDTNISQKTNETGEQVAISEPLSKSIKFKNVINGETSLLKQNQIKAFLSSNGFQEEEDIGQFSADLNGHIRAFAPIFAYGLTEKLSLALVTPIYSAQTSVAVGFKPTERGKKFIEALSNPENNLTASAYEAADKINRAIEKLDEKLVTNGYREIKDWEATGLGDMQVAGKYAVVDSTWFRFSTTGGIVAPTGRTKNPDVLNDIGFGDGQWDLFGQLTLDQPLPLGFVINQYAKYTNQLPGQKNARKQTEEEPLEVPSAEVDFKLGDKFDAGVGVQYTPDFGLLTGLGYNYQRKYTDRYSVKSTSERLDTLEKNSDQEAHYLEAMLGYSTIPAFQRKSVAAPVEVKASYLKQLRSQNLPITDFYQFDASLYF